jgi:hypothetical protein
LGVGPGVGFGGGIGVGDGPGDCCGDKAAAAASDEPRERPIIEPPVTIDNSARVMTFIDCLHVMAMFLP